MIPYYLADQILEWGKDNNFQVSISPSINFTITRNATELLEGTPPFMKSVAQNAFTILDLMVVFGFVGIGLMVALKVIRHRDDFTRLPKPKSISIHKRIMLKLGLAEVKENGKS